MLLIQLYISSNQVILIKFVKQKIRKFRHFSEPNNFYLKYDCVVLTPTLIGF